MIINLNNPGNNITRTLVHGYKVHDDNVGTCLLCFLQPLQPDHHVGPAGSGSVQGGGRMEEECLPVRGEDTLGDEEYSIFSLF